MADEVVPPPLPKIANYLERNWTMHFGEFFLPHSTVEVKVETAIIQITPSFSGITIRLVSPHAISDKLNIRIKFPDSLQELDFGYIDPIEFPTIVSALTNAFRSCIKILHRLTVLQQSFDGSLSPSFSIENVKCQGITRIKIDFKIGQENDIQIYLSCHQRETRSYLKRLRRESNGLFDVTLEYNVVEGQGPIILVDLIDLQAISFFWQLSIECALQRVEQVS